MKKTLVLALILLLGGCLNLDLFGIRRIMAMDPYDVDIVGARALVSFSSGVSFKTPPKITMQMKENDEVVREEVFLLKVTPTDQGMILPTKFRKLQHNGYIVQLDPADAERANEIQNMSQELDKDHTWVEPETKGREPTEQAKKVDQEWDVSIGWEFELAEDQRDEVCRRGKSPKSSIWVDLDDGNGFFRVVKHMPFKKLFKDGNWQDMLCKTASKKPEPESESKPETE